MNGSVILTTDGFPLIFIAVNSRSLCNNMQKFIHFILFHDV